MWQVRGSCCCWQLCCSSHSLSSWCNFSLVRLPAGRVVRGKCEQLVAAYKLERSKHINRDPALGECSACLVLRLHEQQQQQRQQWVWQVLYTLQADWEGIVAVLPAAEHNCALLRQSCTEHMLTSCFFCC
jgi:hypothetical protein